MFHLSSCVIPLLLFSICRYTVAAFTPQIYLKIHSHPNLMTKITHSVRFFFKMSKRAVNSLTRLLTYSSSLCQVVFLLVLATVPSASAQSPVSYIASPSLPIFNHETHSYPSPTVHQTSFLLPCTFSPSLL